jgi:putative membrane protein
VALSTGILAVVAYLLLGHRPSAGMSPAVAALPLLNACLNAGSAGLITAGFLFIRRKKVNAHRACMLGAVAVSAIFLISYVTYHWLAGSRAFTGQGWIRPVYFIVLVSHIGLAAVLPPAVLSTLYLALRRDFTRHRRLARWTLPVWLYVSVTGVLVYWMAHRLASP